MVKGICHARHPLLSFPRFVAYLLTRYATGYTVKFMGLYLCLQRHFVRKHWLGSDRPGDCCRHKPGDMDSVLRLWRIHRWYWPDSDGNSVQHHQHSSDCWGLWVGLIGGNFHRQCTRPTDLGGDHANCDQRQPDHLWDCGFCVHQRLIHRDHWGWDTDGGNLERHGDHRHLLGDHLHCGEGIQQRHHRNERQHGQCNCGKGRIGRLHCWDNHCGFEWDGHQCNKHGAHGKLDQCRQLPHLCERNHW